MVFLRDIFGKQGNTANKGMFDLKIGGFLVFLLVFLFAIPAQGRYSGGNGEPNTPYRIGTAEDLNDIANHPNDFTAHFIMVNDINMAGYTYSTAPIAPDMDNTHGGFDGNSFTGVFDGNSYKITNLTINTDGEENGYLGLFGEIGISGKVKNLGIEGVSITGGDDSDYLGGLCGVNSGTIFNCYLKGNIGSGLAYSWALGGLVGLNDGTISNCYTSGEVNGYYFSGVGSLCGYNAGIILDCYSIANVTGGGDSDYLGGLCGYNYEGTISNCYATGNITGNDWLGGLCGYNDYGTISNCYATGDVNGEDISRWLGGLCGTNSGRTISNCYATGSVTGGTDSYDIGGLCGINDEGTISNCYATGSVTGGDSSYLLGGLCGKNKDGTILNCYATGNITGNDHLGGLCGENDKSMISNCYATGSVSGGNNSNRLGGLCGGNWEGTISNCYATGSVNGDDYIGGFIGYNYSSSYTSCFWDITVNPSLADCGYDYDTHTSNVDMPDIFAETTVSMQTESTFTDEGWDFVGETINSTGNHWRMCINGVYYPKLSWEFPMMDFLCPDGVDFIDYSYFANCWDLNDPNCDFDESGYIDANDLILFGDDWLLGL